MGWRLGGPKGAREMLSSRVASPFFGAQPRKQELGLGDLSSMGVSPGFTSPSSDKPSCPHG